MLLRLIWIYRMITRRLFVLPLFASVAGSVTDVTFPSGATAQLLLGQPSKLSGTYRAPTGEHPFVFATPAQMRCYLTSKGPGFVKARANLEKRVRSVIANPDRYTTPFSGCTISTYLHNLTYEYGGAAHVAADLATYAYLASLKMGFGDAALADNARDVAKSILMRWAVSGFRDNGKLRTQLSDFCDDKGQDSEASRSEIGLQIGRGIPNWVQAQDMLLAVNALRSARTRRAG
jgi:hypothetical protein